MMDNQEEEFALDETIRRLAKDSYGATTGDIPRDAMWDVIQSRRSSSLRVVRTSEPLPPAVQRLSVRAPRRPWAVVAAMAATLAVGVAIGRSATGGAPLAGVAHMNSVATADSALVGALPVMLAQLTNEHLERSEALLVSARQDLGREAPDAMLGAWARDLLSTTRLLLDTQQITDPRLRQLLQDLELTLALIQQAQASGRAADVQSVRDDLESSDLLLRVRDAAVPSMLSTEQIRGMSE